MQKNIKYKKYYQRAEQTITSFENYTENVCKIRLLIKKNMSLEVLILRNEIP